MIEKYKLEIGNSKELLKYLKKYTKVANLYIHNDTSYRGVAYSKNMCFYNLRFNTYNFVFDDDCFPFIIIIFIVGTSCHGST